MMAWRDEAPFKDRRGNHPPFSEAAQARIIRRKLARGEPLRLAVLGAQLPAEQGDLLLWNRLGLRQADALAGAA